MLVYASAHVVSLIERYDALLEEIYRARRAFARHAQVLVNPVTVRFREDAPAGYGTGYDMSEAYLPDLKRLGDVVYEWQSIRVELVKLLADPATDKQSCLFLDSKLHVRAGAC